MVNSASSSHFRPRRRENAIQIDYFTPTTLFAKYVKKGVFLNEDRTPFCRRRGVFGVLTTFSDADLTNLILSNYSTKDFANCYLETALVFSESTTFFVTSFLTALRDVFLKVSIIFLP